jgi:predicted transcriptional regulator
MLEGLLGNKSARQVLLDLYHNGEVHASAIAQDFNVAVTPIRHQLDRLENAGLLVSREAGRTRLYSFNPKSPFSRPIKEIIKIEYESLPVEMRQKIFQRRRPRRKGKQVIART